MAIKIINDQSGGVLPDRNMAESLLVAGDTVDGAVDYKGRPARRCKSGSWRSVCFLIGVEAAERGAYYGILSNLMNFLTKQLHQSMATAASNVNVWVGTTSLLSLFAAFFADSYIGRYRTIIVASFTYILGLGLLTFSTMLPSLINCESQVSHKVIKPRSTRPQAILFFIALYIVALGQGGHKPCIQAFSADQFDEHHPKESKERSSFFNWWYFSSCAFCLLTVGLSNYIQDNLSWVLGFGIPSLLLVVALVTFIFGTKTYRFITVGDRKQNPFIRIGRVFVAALRNWKVSTVPDVMFKEETCGTLSHPSPSRQFSFLNKALLAQNDSYEDVVFTLKEVEEAKTILRLVPIWTTSLVYCLASSQTITFFTKQGNTMNRTIFPGFDIPAASLQLMLPGAIVFFTPIYDCIIVQIASSITNKPYGITTLQRIGTGMVISIVTLVIAALVEMKRLQAVKNFGLIDEPNAIVPMSVWWLIPQYFLFGVADVFTMVGLQEFFYDQVPNELRSMGSALFLSISGMGCFLSSFMISVVKKLSSDEDGQSNWFDDNINQAHLDYFYWLLVAFSTMAFVVYIFYATSYCYYQKGIILQ
ncbi:protein NRT1/ PTR FAMILY 5.10-like [Prosopis cineraria]|uniref:protein NRT1/ PTR FAMILY 5.10-like n=1 Tax=Prosopis cineraria TaxID=364024 RepID=UPI002410A196|nr:protein NRT1/ PTR FAMILY 5.10-like [Prosopis cineraria]